MGERRTASRKAMFDMLDLRQGPPRGWIGLEQFVNWATDHLITKVATIDMHADVDYYHIEQYGKINAAEFDGLCEDVASLPRRFGLAPSWEKEYGTVERRTASLKAMFDMLDLRQGPARSWIGLEQFVRWSFDHVVTKA